MKKLLRNWSAFLLLIGLILIVLTVFTAAICIVFGVLKVFETFLIISCIFSYSLSAISCVLIFLGIGINNKIYY